MAIKWKNNKSATKETELENLEKKPKKAKVWLGYLLVCIFITVVSVATYCMQPEVQKVREKSEKAKEEQLSEQKDKALVDFGYCSDRDKMSLISNIYYLNYKMENMYDGLSVDEYLLKNNKEYKNLTDAQAKKN